jgi:hypothetical protein
MSATGTPTDTPGMLAMLALAKNQRVDPGVIATYAQILAPYPPDAVAGAIVALAADAGEFFPPVGRVIAEMARWLRGCVAPNGRAPVLAPDEAWHAARLTISRYQPATRPQPLSGNPAIDGALRQLGGVAACQWDDHVGEGIVRRRFLDEYERQIATPEHLAWALSPAATLPPALPTIELPAHEIERFRRVAVAEGLVRYIERRTVVIGTGAPEPPALPPTVLADPLTPERRDELRAEVKAAIGQLAARWSMRRAIETVATTEGTADDDTPDRAAPVRPAAGSATGR